MKFMMIVLLLLAQSFAHAKGYISVENRYFQDTGNNRPVVGFGIYEKLLSSGKVAYNGWSGYGQPDTLPEFQDVNWLVTRHQLDFQIKDFTISPGFQINWVDLPAPNENLTQEAVFVRVAYKLWN
jgi:hypothetical protein